LNVTCNSVYRPIFDLFCPVLFAAQGSTLS
jgi:hypothetical protein